MQPRQALIIGGTGFISTFAVEHLAAAGYAVTIITRGNKPDVHGPRVAARLCGDREDPEAFGALLRSSLTLSLQQQQQKQKQAEPHT